MSLISKSGETEPIKYLDPTAVAALYPLSIKAVPVGSAPLSYTVTV